MKPWVAPAKVLGEANERLNTRQMIQAMSAKGFWTSSGGKALSTTAPGKRMGSKSSFHSVDAERR